MRFEAPEQTWMVVIFAIGLMTTAAVLTPTLIGKTYLPGNNNSIPSPQLVDPGGYLFETPRIQGLVPNLTAGVKYNFDLFSDPLPIAKEIFSAGLTQGWSWVMSVQNSNGVDPSNILGSHLGGQIKWLGGTNTTEVMGYVPTILSGNGSSSPSDPFVQASLPSGSIQFDKPGDYQINFWLVDLNVTAGPADPDLNAASRSPILSVALHVNDQTPAPTSSPDQAPSAPSPPDRAATDRPDVPSSKNDLWPHVTIKKHHHVVLRR